jgi:hypothetical protein
MKKTKLFLIAVTSLMLGFISCNNDNDIPSSGEQEGNTNVSVTLSMSLKETKSLPDDYNTIGDWAGKDKIEKVAIYLLDGTTVTTKTYTVGTGASDGYTQEAVNADNQVVLKPKEAIRTTAGIKKVYVLVNGKPEVEAALAVTPADNFENAYRTAQLTLSNSGTNLIVSSSADKLAQKNGTTDETIVMTNDAEVTINVAANVSEEDALRTTNPLNRVSVKVERTVARVMVTTAAETYEIKSGADVLGTISNITWVLAQGESALFIQRKANYATPNYGWIPASNTDYNNTAGSKYDYSGLFENYNATTQFGGTAVPTMTDYATATKDKITAELNTKLSGKFILPNTHITGAAEVSGYKKGNTAYVLVRAKFTPSSFADGETYAAGADFFVGANGKFYTTAANAQTPAKGGVANQTVAKYIGGKVLYYAWVNPDNVPNWYNSPVIRNNVYHIHISGFKNLGTNWNPLYPEDPTTPTPTNPDPKPVVPGVNEPENPIDPTDPLTTPETWMSVDVTVLPWKLHSYSVVLGL